jgi:hypothetical protein
VRYVLGDTHDNDPEGRQQCEQANRVLVATRRGAYPHHDDAVEVRRIFHKLRSQAIEPFNGLFKNMFEWRTQRPVQGLQRSQLLALSAIVVVSTGVALSTRAPPNPRQGHEAPLKSSVIYDHISTN